VVMEANLDDLTPELVADAARALLSAGALDAWTEPATMKKGRPALTMAALTAAADADRVAAAMLQETTTIGVRKYPVDRTTLDREFVEVETEYGRVRIKVSKLAGEVVNFAPEFDDCVRLARENNVPLKKMQAVAINAYLVMEPPRG